MVSPLLVGWRRNWDDLVGPCVERRGDTPDGPTLPGGVPPLEYQNRRDTVLLGVALEQIETALLLFQRRVEHFLWNRLLHSLRRLTVSPFPAPSTPAKTIITGNFASLSCRCTPSNSPHSASACFL